MQAHVVAVQGVPGCILALLLSMALPTSVRAHAFAEHAEPPAGAVLTLAPQEVWVRFDRRLELAFSSLEILDSAGKRVNKRDSQVISNDGRTIKVALRTLDAGIYRVRWIAVPLDGHRTTGDYTFTIR